MNHIVIERLRLRGTHATRLARVASTALPAALDRALADLTDARIEMLPITLDFDPADYDDATLATLWADAILKEVLSAGATLRDPETHESTSGTLTAPAQSGSVSNAGLASSAPQSPPNADPRAFTAALHTWLDAGAQIEAMPRIVAELLQEDATDGSVPVLPPDEMSRLARRLLPVAARHLSRTHHPANGERGHAPSLPEPPKTAPALSPDRVPHDAASSVTSAAETEAGFSGEEVARWLHRVAALTDPSDTVVDLLAVSAVGGLVLLYPWLAAYCEQASEELPGVEPPRARAGALSVLATGGLDALDDPLIRLLAGSDLGSNDTNDLEALLIPPALASVEGVLSRFAALLPGFSESTAAFVRESWIGRLALIDAASDPAHVSAETAPLDILLPALPYPLTGFRLPWTNVILVRFSP